jgi:hypothetical protein
VVRRGFVCSGGSSGGSSSGGFGFLCLVLFPCLVLFCFPVLPFLVSMFLGTGPWLGVFGLLLGVAVRSLGVVWVLVPL